MATDAGQILNHELGWSTAKIARFFEYIDTKIPGGWSVPIVEPDDMDWEQIFNYEFIYESPEEEL